MKSVAEGMSLTEEDMARIRVRVGRWRKDSAGSMCRDFRVESQPARKPQRVSTGQRAKNIFSIAEISEAREAHSGKKDGREESWLDVLREREEYANKAMHLTPTRRHAECLVASLPALAAPSGRGR